jgi:SprT protein
MKIDEDALTEATRQWLEKAKTIYNRDFIMPKLDFSLIGRTAGEAHYHQWKIRYNIPLYNRHPSEFLARTVPHELAHLITWNLYGTVIARRPHGSYWKMVMHKLGVDAKRCHSFDTNGLVRQRKKAERPFTYKCHCRTFHLTNILHSRILAGQKRWCRACKTTLQFVGVEP